ncbi:MAG: glycerol acyltransferase [Betaproteobacteria bacterium RIFCSPLOWO2_12_FULL_65_14]|nr:MAG: glycerol acyltransferase [Betaproteobacteria bacterium RIFCSPLOWO2_12_FULL_65_14]
MSERSQFRLLAERRFGPFFAVQFLGAMNDNVFKQALVILLAYQTAAFTSMSSDALQNVAQALFILPFFLFSATAGQLADKYEKSNLITVTVALELAIMLLGAVGFLLKNLSILLAALFLGGVQSTLFGPVKYAILPQHLKETELVGGNGLVEMGTSVAILLGMVVGGWLVIQPGWGVVGAAVFTCALAAAGIALSRFIPKAPPADPGLRINWNPITETVRNLRFTARNRTVFLSILGISWFWFYGAMLVTQFPNLSRNVLAGSEAVVTLLLVAFSLGIGFGSLLCERLSGHKVELGLVPFGSIGLTVFAIDLWLATDRAFHLTGADIGALIADPGARRVLIDLVFIGLFGGFYIVPLYALIQSRSDPQHRSRVIAGNNILNAAFMVAAALIAIAFFAAGLTIPQLIFVLAIMNAVVAVYIYTLVPEFLMRFLVWILIHSVYRLKKLGIERIPEEGPAILICNHVSYVDALVISAACRRPIRWVMDHRIFGVPVLSFFFRTARAIPIAPAKEDSGLLERAYARIAEELAAGELVGLFPEGRLTSDGEMGEFRGGILRVVEETPVPVVPMALSGLWQSLFARNRDKLRHLTRLFPRIRLAVGRPLGPPELTLEAMRSAVLELRGEWK